MLSQYNFLASLGNVHRDRIIVERRWVKVSNETVILTCVLFVDPRAF